MTQHTHIKKAVLQNYPFFNFQIVEDEDDTVKAYPKQDYSILTLLKILHPLTVKPKRFSDLYSDSQVRFKRRFLDYLHFSEARGFINTEKVKEFQYYNLTTKGYNFMEMFH